jgi:hypothetical protein
MDEEEEQETIKGLERFLSDTLSGPWAVVIELGRWEEGMSRETERQTKSKLETVGERRAERERETEGGRVAYIFNTNPAVIAMHGGAGSHNLTLTAFNHPNPIACHALRLWVDHVGVLPHDPGVGAGSIGIRTKE